MTADGHFKVPTPVNEPIRAYAPGDPARTSLKARLAELTDARTDVPMIAAGGICDGRGMAAAFALGAEGVAMGTRFLTSADVTAGTGASRPVSFAPTPTAGSSWTESASPCPRRAARTI